MDAILFATGRAPNVNNIGLEAAGVEFDPVNGVKVNDFLQSTQKHIFSGVNDPHATLPVVAESDSFCCAVVNSQSVTLVASISSHT